ncbi:MAG: radical SAM protein [Myxococcales bacterium]|nr:radical SAM protein [Myxococcales bacterium]
MDRVEQVEIQLGHLCNNRCVFCSSGLQTSRKEVGQQDPEPVYRHLAESAARGARRVTFVGGEPTLQRELPRYLERARALGYTEIVLFTNGVRGPQAAYFAELLAGGPLELRISIQGGDAATHDRVVGRQGAFGRILALLELARERGQHVTVNACLNVLSYASVGGYPELARRYGVRQVHLDQVNPREIGDRPPGHLGTILARYSAQAPHLARMLGAFERDLGPEYDVNVGNYPYCLMPEWAHRIHHGGESTEVVPADFGTVSDRTWDKYGHKTAAKQKPARCAECAFDPVCTGVFDEYAERFGTDELTPIPRERLARQRNAPRLFTLVARAPLRRLLAAGAPPGYERVAAEVHDCDPEARLGYRTPSGAVVTVAVRHARAPGTPLVAGELASLHAVDETLADGALPLFAWVATELGERAPVGLDPPTAARLVAWAARARRSLAQIVTRLVDSGQAREATWTADGESASCAIRASEAEGEELRVRFVTRPAFSRPPVRAIFAVGSEDEASAAPTPAVGRVMHSLRAALAAAGR